MKVLFLDVDGVLNCPEMRHPNGHLPICASRAMILNGVLRSVPDLKIVVSSAWRYHVHKGEMTVEGLAELFMSHGLDCRKRVLGVTEADPFVYPHRGENGEFDLNWWREQGLKWRSRQIRKWLAETWCDVDGWAVLDDLPLDVENLFQTDEAVGITDEIADALRAHFEGGGQ